jgi:hypothetical protein
MAPWIASLLLALGSASAQQVYISAAGPSPRPQCTATAASSEPTYSPFASFAYSMTETVRTATSVRPGSTTTYAAPASSLTSLISSLSYTTWGKWNPNATTKANDTANPYGRAAWTSMWKFANPPNFTETSVFSTTVSPTPLPSSELVLPPAEYFGPSDCYHFPADFMFGVAGSSAQIEGATADEGKGPSLMDILIQDDRPKDYVTNENYYYYKQEIERLASMGVKYYSFSIAWSRILPFALPGTPVNQQGLDHYSDLIDFVLEKGMIPVVTILHFDTPMQFFAANLSMAQAAPMIGYSNGGYQNKTFVDAYVNYAKIVMTHYADRVPVWFTFNEPFIYSFNGLSVDHVIKAHAKVYHFYKEEINGTGKVSLKFNDNFGVPRDPKNPSDVYAANHFNSFQLGMFCNPIFLGEDYPESYKNTVPDYVPLNASELAYINGTADFLGIDPYTVRGSSSCKSFHIHAMILTSSNRRPSCLLRLTTPPPPSPPAAKIPHPSTTHTVSTKALSPRRAGTLAIALNPTSTSRRATCGCTSPTFTILFAPRLSSPSSAFPSSARPTSSISVTSCTTCLARITTSPTCLRCSSLSGKTASTSRVPLLGVSLTIGSSEISTVISACRLSIVRHSRGGSKRASLIWSIS